MISSPDRLEGAAWGLLIDRQSPVHFTFNGASYEGYKGDVIASALVASGRHVLSRSFKYHRPRGVLTMAGHDANALVQVGSEPNVRADRHAIDPGMKVNSINHLGSLDHDWLSVAGLFSRFLPVGFYYKTFFRPRGAWKLFERPIRQMAGLGTLDPKAHHGYFDKQYLFSDLVVVGGGPAGLSAAIAAASTGAETLLIDEWPELGGSLLFGRFAGSRTAATGKRMDLLAQAQKHPNLRIMTAASVSGLFADNWLAVLKGNRLYKVRAKNVVLATGAYNQPMVFKNNDLPGIMFADAAQRLMRLYGVRPGKEVVVATSNRFGFDAALDLLEAGIDVKAVVDLGDNGHSTEAVELNARGVRILSKSTIVEATGERRVSAVKVARNIDQAHPGATETIECDCVLMSVGYSPAVNLACHTGVKVKYSTAINMHYLEDLPSGLHVVGSAAGVWADALVTEHAAQTGRFAGFSSLGREAGNLPKADDTSAQHITHAWPITPSTKDFVDFDEDICVTDIRKTVEAGYDDIQLVKRYSTAGLGPSQGRHTNVNMVRLVSQATGRDIESVGLTTYRPPLFPEKFGQLAGRGFEPTRLTAMHERHLALGAQMMPAGQWMRPAYYGRPQEIAEAIAREVHYVRDGVGIIDVSTLGGLELRGPDAAAFLDRFYTFNFLKQPVGRTRYALLTDEAGVVIDDGVACRLHDEHFYVTATTSAVDQVYRLMGFWNTQWKFNLDIANVTSAYAGMNLAGPKSRAVLAKLETDIDFSTDAFPYLAVRTGHIAGIPVRVLRVGFVGELGYEIHCLSRQGAALWDILMTAGQDFGIKPFGVEAQRILRLEKGHIIVGQDTDGLTNPLEANMAWALSKTKPSYLGKRSIDMQAAKGIARKLVGFTLLDDAVCPKENHIILDGDKIVGRVTSVVRSPTLNKVIGLAYLPTEQSAVGSKFTIKVDGKLIAAQVAAAPFYDPENKRQEM